tara:strand:- start:102 stop:959 length:858 start_codon:yes stop_codon:yes gene_type:complete
MGRQKPNNRNRKSKRRDKRNNQNVDANDLLFEERYDLTADNIETTMADGCPKDMNTVVKGIIGKKPYVKPKTENQGKLMTLIQDNIITFAHGPAGTGKSFIATFSALKLLWNANNKIDKIVIIKPACEVVGEKIGYLPGSAEDKISVYAYSTLNIIEKIVGATATEQLVSEGFIKPSPLGFIRGCTFDNAVVILEEGQNTSKEQMKTFLSRIGENSKYIVTGDVNQSDRFHKNPNTSGLADALTRLKGIDGIETDFEFDQDDIVRNPIIKKILFKYEMLGDEIVE